jgi:hypothetical protein
MTTTLKLCLLVIAGVAGSLTFQTPSSDSSSIENCIRTKEPAWELSVKKVKPDSTSYRWKLGAKQIDVHVFVTDSQQAAAAKFNEYGQHVPIPPKERLKSPGDEALLFQGVNTDECMILFRRGNIFVHLNGTSVADAKRFAKHLDDLFRPK